MNKQPELTEKTRRAFMEAFCLIYMQKPLEKISVQEVARKAGYNRSTFYQYFFDLNDLLGCVEKDLLDYVRSSREAEKSDSFDNESFVQSLIRIYEAKSVYFNALLGEFGSNRFLEQIKKSLPLNWTWMEQAKDSRLVPYLVEYRVSVVLSLFNLWRRREKDLSSAEFFDLVDALYKAGLSVFYPAGVGKEAVKMS